MAWIDVSFDEAISSASLAISDIVVVGPGGAVPVLSATLTSPTTVRFDLEDQVAPGNYTITIGPGINDLAGNPLDQDGDGVNGEPEDIYLFLTTITNTNQSVLLVNVNDSYNADAANLYSTLLTADARVKWLNLDSDGKASSALAADAFDQVWVFDLSSGSDPYTNDWQAIADWYDASPTHGMIVDGLSPSAGSTFLQGRDITFTAQQRSGAPPVSYVWSSSIDGVFGATESFTTKLLSPGVHQITVMATDAVNNTANEHFALTVTADVFSPIVTSFTPLGPRNSPVNQFTIGFDEAITAASFQATDLVVIGPGGTIDTSAWTITPSSDRQFTVGTASLSLPGVYSILVGPQINDLFGNAMGAAHSASFEIDQIGPRVIAVSRSGVIQTSVDNIDVTFDSPLNSSSFTAVDVALSGPAGAIATSNPYRLSGNTYSRPWPSTCRWASTPPPIALTRRRSISFWMRVFPQAITF